MHLHLSLLVPLVSLAITSTYAHELPYPPKHHQVSPHYVSHASSPKTRDYADVSALTRRQVRGEPSLEQVSKEVIAEHHSSRLASSSNHHELHMLGKKNNLLGQRGPAHTYFRDPMGERVYRLQKTTDNKFKSWEQERPVAGSEVEKKYLATNDALMQDFKAFRHQGRRPWRPARSKMSDEWQKLKGILGGRREYPGSMYMRER